MMSFRGAFGSRIPDDSVGGDCEFGSRGIGYGPTAGELYPDCGAEPEEYSETESSQSLEPPLAELVEETESRRLMGSVSSFLIDIDPGGSSFGPLGLATLPCFRDLLPARSSSNRSGRGRKCVLSYRPHLLQTIFPGVSVDRRHEGGSVVWQL
jgi:hypothetical protein